MKLSPPDRMAESPDATTVLDRFVAGRGGHQGLRVFSGIGLSRRYRTKVTEPLRKLMNLPTNPAAPYAVAHLATCSHSRASRALRHQFTPRQATELSPLACTHLAPGACCGPSGVEVEATDILPIELEWQKKQKLRE
jgi:hypothetical protein